MIIERVCCDSSVTALVRLLSLRTDGLSERQVIEFCGDDFSLDRAAEAARLIGLSSRVVHLRPSEFSNLSTPTLLEMKDGSLSLMRRAAGRHIDIDRAGVIRRISLVDFASRFSGRALDFNRQFADGTTAARRVLTTIFENRRGLVLGVSAAALVQLVGVMSPILTRIIVDHALPNAASSLLTLAALGVVWIAAFQALFEWLRQRSMLYFEAQSGLVLDRGILEHLIRLPYRVLQSRTTGQLLQTFQSLQTVRNSIAAQGFVSIAHAIAVVAYLFAVAMLVPGTLLTLAASGVLIALLGTTASLLEARVSRLELKASTAEITLAAEAICNASTIKAAGAERHVMKRWVELLHTREFYTLKRQQLVSTFGSAVDSLQQFLICGALLWCGILVFHGRLSAGSMIATMQLVMGFLASTALFVNGIGAIINVAPQWDRVTDILDRPAQQPHLSGMSRRLSGPIVCDHVSFRYSADEPWVLTEFNLRVEANDRFSLTAQSGWGKSTILRLIAGLYEPGSGRITIGGVKPNLVREQIAYLPQFTTPISGSIINALRFFSGGASTKRLLEVAADTGLHEWVHDLPMQYETVLSSRGETVSGGQRQLIALTGVLASDCPILLFDEFAACLDLPTRERILSSRFLDDRTVILASPAPAETMLDA